MKPLDRHLKRDSFGAKAANLSTLIRNGFNVPPGAVIPMSWFDRFCGTIQAELSELTITSSHQELQRNVLALFRQIGLPNELSDNIAESFHKASSRFAVRSSGMIQTNNGSIEEDSAGCALAGHFDSILRVRSDELPDAVLRCWASCFSERILVTGNATSGGAPVTARTAVIIQTMIDAAKSFVVMTQDPLDSRFLGIESTLGPCENLVNGTVTGDLMLLDRRSLFEGDFSQVTQQASETCLSAQEAVLLINTALRVEGIFGIPQDIEGVFFEASLFLTQTRPISAFAMLA